ncbi:S8 family serine peptidase, partial [Aquipuribacter hungaricus]|uniref:S8 family serine peptidase n=1 Tax=Aquipuribacter hungaricus TaxID=545624 RepID=UPI0030EF1F3C
SDLAGARTVPVLVEGEPGALAQVVSAVEAAGGTVGTELAVLDGVRADVPAGAVGALRAAPGVLDVTADSTLVPLDAAWGDDSTGEGRRASLGGSWLSRLDRGSLWSVAEQVGADDVWAVPDPADPRRTLTGVGVGVALIDTGVAPVEGLTVPGTVVRGPDLSFDSQAPGTRGTDGMGHGTHMAGIVAGRDSGLRTGKEHDVRNHAGIAPGARVVDVKVGAGDGGVDVSQVVAALDWVVANRARHGIRVVNLSYGTASVQPYQLDPLAHAVESAWHAGVVVVVAAGNDGEAGPVPLTMPAADPFVIAVGSSDHRGSSDPARWRTGAWTNSGTDARRPDLLAPGKSVVSLRVPGSLADTEHPEGRVAGDRSGRFFRGTGTSQSAAVVSGAVALLLQAEPRLTPDQVKGLLRSTADRLPGETGPAQGAGVLIAAAAVALLLLLVIRFKLH